MVISFVKKNILILFILFQVSGIQAQQGDEIVARAGETVITKEEFFKRYEFTPRIKTESAFNQVTYKKDLLLTMIAEKLLARAAGEEKLESSNDYRIMMQYLRNIYLRDALYKIEVKDKIAVPDSELVKGRKRILKSFRTKFIFSEEEEEIRKIYSAVAGGASFDSLLDSRPERYEQTGSREVTFGTMHPKLEELIYNLLPGEITLPVQLQEGWYICKVYSVSEKAFLDEKEKREVEKIASRRIEDNLYQDFYRKFFKGVNVTADRALFSELAGSIQKYLSENVAEFSGKRDNKHRLVEKDFYRIRENIRAEALNAIFIKFAASPLTLSQFIDNIMLESLELESSDEQHVRSKLNSYIRTFIRNELLAREALKRGYEKLNDVAAELKSWSDFYLSRMMMKKIFSQNPVSDEDAYSFFEKSQGIVAHPDQVKIAEILVGDLESVETIFNELDIGKEFKELAQKYTLRDSLRSRGGEFGYFSIEQNGELGKSAKQMKTGDILGPIKTREGYSIIKLLDRKEGEKMHYEKFADAKEEIKNYIRTDKMYKKLDGITAKLAVDNGVEINEKALQSIKVTDINMIVFRRFGFGGQLIAAPYSPDFSSWFRVFEQMKKNLSL